MYESCRTSLDVGAGVMLFHPDYISHRCCRNRFPSDDELFELASHVLQGFLVNVEFWAQPYPSVLSVPADRVSFLQKMWCYFISGQNFCFLSNVTTAFKIKRLYMWLKFENYGDKWKAEIFLLGIILLLMWNLLSSITSCSLYMCQISDSLVSVLVFELFMCVAADSKYYQDSYTEISCNVLHLKV